MSKQDVIDETIRVAMEQYFADLGGENACGVYDMVLARVERPLLEVVLKHCSGNQTRAATVLGLNRNTLRKKLMQHEINC
ncbi:MAG: Fis family transcriptional regulator [Neisseriaceae bacterium]|nr:Fis family transcriptional regulator [Neisseriaceae bacterium]